MAGFGFDDDDFSLSGLTQEGHDSVTVINSSSSDDENYDGLLECARQLAGETSNKSLMEGGMQAGVEPGVSNILISKMSDTGWERLIRSHSSARFCFELSGNSD